MYLYLENILTGGVFVVSSLLSLSENPLIRELPPTVTTLPYNA